MTIRMIRQDDGKTGDIHPDEVENMKAHGWEVVEGEAAAGGDDASDDAIRDEIERLTGKRPHHKTGSAKLAELLAEAQAGE